MLKNGFCTILPPITAHAAPVRVPALMLRICHAVTLPTWYRLPPGSGTSHLAGAVAHALRARGVPLLAATSEALLRCLRQGMADRSSDDRLAALQTVAVLILDDLGVEHRTPWAFEKLYALLHTRAETGRATPKECRMQNAECRLNTRTQSVFHSSSHSPFSILHFPCFPVPRAGGQRHPPAAGNVRTFQRSNVLTF
jgi:hypothetical protein